MKKIIWLIMGLVVIAGGFYLYNQRARENTPDKAASSLSEARQPVDPKTVKVGDTFGPLRVSAVKPIKYNSLGTPIEGGVDFSGKIVLRGVVDDSNPYAGPMFVPNKEDQAKFPVSVFNSEDRAFMLEDPSHQLYTPSGEPASFLGKEVTVELEEFQVFFGAPPRSTAKFVRVLN